ncbi:MAG: hypothetical protein LBE82_08175 [Chitinophagaceae bacterium]|jgi:hypothetical protein|nr:hypothetical protein [Chitinophagaceae bacterium]
MSYYEKLVKLLGREPYNVEYNRQIFGLKTKEDSAKSIFNGLLTIPKEKAKAKKLGLI